MTLSSDAKTIIFFVSEDWYFCSHRMPIARAARDAGYRVIVITRVRNHGKIIENEGFVVEPIEFNRGGFSVLFELRTLSGLFRIYRKYAPTLVHHVALKPSIYGSFVSIFVPEVKVINALAGLGFLFISDRLRERLLKDAVLFLLRYLASRVETKYILQNADDVKYFSDNRISQEDNLILVPGSGVDTEVFYFSREAEGDTVVILPSRMLWDKGIFEFVKAAWLLKEEGVLARFVLVGDVDVENPSSIPKECLEKWSKDKVIEWWGFREDMVAVLSKSSIVCLPSYREGLPKALLEAASMGRAIVTSDVPGCRSIVKNGVNGLLVPARDYRSLADALRCLINDPKIRRQMGEKGRELVVNEFAERMVVNKTLSLYTKMTAS